MQTHNVTLLTTLIAGFGFWIRRTIPGDVTFPTALQLRRVLKSTSDEKFGPGMGTHSCS